VLSRKITLERYSYHNNSPAQPRLKARVLEQQTSQKIEAESGLERTDNSRNSIGVTVLSRSPIDIHHSSLGNIRIVDLQWQQTFTLERSPVATDYTICVPISGRIEWQDPYHLATTAMAIDPGRSFPGITSTNGRVLVVGFDRQSIKSVLTKLLDRELKQPVSFESTINLDTDFGTSLKELIEFLGRTSDLGLNITSPMIQAELASALLVCLLKGVKHNYSDEILYCCQGAFACYVKQASLFIEAHLQDEIELTDIAAAVNISPRLLQKAFAREHDCSPMRFVARARLERIRQELERSSDDTRIIDVMMNYGISQGGKFAKEYQQLFGEKPSDTLKRSSQLDRPDHPLWQEIDDACSERIIGGAVLAHAADLSRSVPNLLPTFDRDPAIWGSYLQSIGIYVTGQFAGDLDRFKIN
jgi:AraC-like DNA-binding protein